MTRETVQVTRTPESVELYFPPLRMPEVTIPLAAFGIITAGVPAVAVIALLPSLMATAASVLSAALIAGFVLPFVAFGAVFFGLAIYMAANALLVRVRSEGIETARILFGVVIKRQHMARSDLARVEAEIASRHQSIFSADPVYQLVALDRERRRMVVGETLRGESVMTHVKQLIEKPLAGT